jgi:phytoene synthase
LTNILRDVGVDAVQGRLYLPAEDLKRFGVSEDDIISKQMTPALRDLLRFEAGRARKFYARAAAELPGESLRAARPALMMGAVYRALLEKLDRNGFPVFARSRARLSGFEKLKSVGGVLWREWIS